MPKPYYQKESGAVIYKMTPSEKQLEKVTKDLKVVSKERDELQTQVNELNTTVVDLCSKYNEILELLNSRE